MNIHNLTTEQQQQLKDIGTNLNQIRVAQNISLDTVSQQTLISQRLLKAIEAGDITELPEAFYIQALVRKYAQAIGAKDVHFDLESDNSSTATHSAQKHRRQYWFNFQLRSLHLYLLYILLVLVSVTGITTLVERPVIVNQASVDNPILAPESKESKSTPQVSRPKAAPQFVSQSSNSATVSVGINLQERCWLKVMVDDRVAFEGVLPAGTKRQWSGKKEVTIRAGNAGGVAISFNNQQQQVLGAPGQVEEVTYTVN
ncbi:MAG: helix-turn-helix domain-containing protein [Pleurocapsa sp. SU_5_0]|nr:helix-turn-helix domain-containing protein [Pleurocapsa sp. SU_5_0]NJO95365.1 helix-turn-helix domain-containing protein [Pleurocapsa sp. CRU_1_2]NJR45093.1 helix-turn-helix domain-containing protein [Hyellaceae cyanobacterium CSU_1_1]